jgi:hypothetical protein
MDKERQNLATRRQARRDRGSVAATNLPPTLSGRQTAMILGCSYWSLLEQVKRGDCPVAPLRLGRRYRWPTQLVFAAVGLVDDDQ